jgi:acid phosphatase type 7
MLIRAQYVALLLATACVEGNEPNTTPDRSVVPRSFPPPAAVWANEVNLVGAGDIAWCSNNGDEATAKLLDTLPGRIFTAGDNA